MTVQMTVRLSEESAAYLDELVSSGQVASRAAALDKLVRRQRRREAAEADAMVYARLRAERGSDEQQEERAWADWASANAATVWSDLE
jgi:Arc/MetJ-type ribon-helix-helix transcriptional regulator